MIEFTKSGSHEHNRGIRGYTANVDECHTCKRLTNVLWAVSWREKPVFACSLECAENYKEIA